MRIRTRQNTKVFSGVSVRTGLERMLTVTPLEVLQVKREDRQVRNLW